MGASISEGANIEAVGIGRRISGGGTYESTEWVAGITWRGNPWRVVSVDVYLDGGTRAITIFCRTVQSTTITGNSVYTPRWPHIYLNEKCMSIGGASTIVPRGNVTWLVKAPVDINASTISKSLDIKRPYRYLVSPASGKAPARRRVIKGADTDSRIPRSKRITKQYCLWVPRYAPNTANLGRTDGGQILPRGRDDELSSLLRLIG
jgi:hypothetical protein